MRNREIGNKMRKSARKCEMMGRDLESGKKAIPAKKNEETMTNSLHNF